MGLGDGSTGQNILNEVLFSPRPFVGVCYSSCTKFVVHINCCEVCSEQAGNPFHAAVIPRRSYHP